jgi:hypothetical protein
MNDLEVDGRPSLGSSEHLSAVLSTQFSSRPLLQSYELSLSVPTTHPNIMRCLKPGVVPDASVYGTSGHTSRRGTRAALWYLKACSPVSAKLND